MRYDVLFVLLNLCVSVADFSPTTENKCKPDANHEDEAENFESKKIKAELTRYITCSHNFWSKSDANSSLYYIMRPRFASFDEASGKLDLLSWVVIYGVDERLKWDKTEFERSDITFYHPDLTFLSINFRLVTEITRKLKKVISTHKGTDDMYERGGKNRTICHIDFEGLIACGENIHQTIRCQTDWTLWPYDRHTCTIIITFWLFAGEAYNFTKPYEKFSPVYMFDFKSDGVWNLSVSRITYDQRILLFRDDVIYPQITIDFMLDRLHSRLKRRFVAPAVMMMIMTLTALWLDPDSYERLAVASMNIVFHMLCIQNLHLVLPSNGITIPNMLLFYIISFVLATVALPLTFFLRKIKNIKTLAPKCISSNVHGLLKSKTGHVFLLVMLDPTVMEGIETRADDTSGLLSSELKEFTWKYMAIFIGWISFFSFFSTYILMYIILIPDSSSRPPIISIA